MPQIKPGRVDRSPRFQPWIGAAAMFDGGVRWHVMGDSHYAGADGYADDPAVTCQVVRDWALQRSAGSAFFTRVAAMILNQEPNSFDRAAAWNGFAFSNFAQRLVTGPRKSPSKEMWDEARACFFGQLVLTRPEVLIVLGDRAWQQLPDDVGVKLPPFRFDVEPEWPAITDGWFYPFEVDGDIVGTVAIKVVHPSAFGGRGDWRIAAARTHTATACHSNILEWIKDTYEVERSDVI